MTGLSFCSFNEAMGRIGLLCHPLRYNITKKLHDVRQQNLQGNIDTRGDPEYQKKWHLQRLSDALSIPRQLVSFHLDTLEENGLIASKMGIIKLPSKEGKGIAGRFYHITYLGILVFEKVREAIKELEQYLGEESDIKANAKFYSVH